MATVIHPMAPENQSEVAALFAERAPVLVEVRFPRMATAPDWYLCEEEADLQRVAMQLGTGVELHLHSVWDLRNVGTAQVIRK